MPSDAIVMLKEDHKKVKALFRDFERSDEGDTAAKQRIATEIIAELTAHTYLENTIMYPEVRKALPDLEDDVLESYEEHHVADTLCQELVELDPADDHFAAKMTVLMENVRHHIEEEEGDWFPKVREGMGRAALLEMGERLAAARAKAPRDPRDPLAVESARKAVTA